MKLIIQILFSLIIVCNVQARVIIKEINIKTELYGPFNKSRVEFIFYNPSERDSLEGFCSFYVNKSAIIKELWLELNDELKRAENFSRRTGIEIYRRITRRKIDPALLIKESEGRFNLRVFPVRKNMYRKAIIEYYSVLENSDSSYLSFKFHSNPSAKKNLLIKGNFQLKTLVYEGINKPLIKADKKLNDNANIINFQKTINFDTEEDINLLFDFSQTNVIPRIYHNNLQLFQYNLNKKIEFIILHEKGDIPKFLRSLIVSIKSENEVYILNQNNSDLFVRRFFEYLLNFASIKEYKYRHDSWRWFLDNDQLFYNDGKLLLSPNKLHNVLNYDNTLNLECPFLDLFIRYNESLDEDISFQKKIGFLNSSLSKLVLEDDERAIRIREDVIRKEELHLNIKPLPPPPPPEKDDSSEIETSTVFCPIDEPPKPLGGYKAIQEKLIYPKFAVQKRIEGRVVLHCLITEEGELTEAKVLLTLHPILDLLAIDAVKKVTWIPAKQRDKPVKVWISIPVIFKIDKDQKYDTIYFKIPKIYNYYERKFTIKEKNEEFIFLEEGFESKSSQTIKYLSDEFFNILYIYPDLIIYPYYLLHQNQISKGIGLVVDSLSKKFVFIEP